MLTPQENELLTRVGPGTPMGEVFRRYWIVAGISREIPEPDSPPVRVRLLGEDLLLFRDTLGRVGLVAEKCAHMFHCHMLEHAEHMMMGQFEVMAPDGFGLSGLQPDSRFVCALRTPLQAG